MKRKWQILKNYSKVWHVSSISVNRIISGSSLFAINTIMSPVVYPFIVYAFFYAIYRVLLITVVLKSYFKHKNGKAFKVSLKTSKQFQLIFQATAIQFTTTLVFAAFVGVWILPFIFPFLGSTPIMKNGTQIAIAFVSLYPIIDVILVLTMVKSYRKSVIKVFTSFGKNDRKISVLASHSVQPVTIRRHSFQP